LNKFVVDTSARLDEFAVGHIHFGANFEHTKVTSFIEPVQVNQIYKEMPLILTMTDVFLNDFMRRDFHFFVQSDDIDRPTLPDFSSLLTIRLKTFRLRSFDSCLLVLDTSAFLPENSL